MKEREETLHPLLQNIKDIEKKVKEDIKRITEEEKEKIKEIEEMVRTGEVGGSNKETLLGRGLESLGDVAERVYLGKERTVAVITENFKEEREKREEEKRELSGEHIKTLTGHFD